MLNQNGVALPLVLIIMLVTATVTLALLGLTTLEPQVAANLGDGTQARFAAEAGLEWAFNVVAGTGNFDTLLAGAGTAGVIMNNPDPMSIGTLAASRGTFTARVRNDIQAASGGNPGDPAITGVAIDGSGSATDDTNSVLIVTATGRRGTAVRNLAMAIRRLGFPPGFFPAALAFPGTEAETTFNGNSFAIDGRGWTRDGSALDGGCQSVYGIAVSTVLPASSPGANEAVVQNALSSQQKDNVQGKKQSPTGNAWGDNTIAPDAVLTPTMVQNFIDQAKANADVVLNSQQPDGLSYSNIGSTCAGSYDSTTCWGTADKPKIVYVKGDPDPTSMFSALTLSGTSEGHGILIVEDGDFRIYGNFTWDGVIIVTGQWVGLGFMGGGNQAVYGSVIVNEEATDPGFREGVVTSNAKIKYSCQAIAAAATARRLTRSSNWRETQ